MILEHLKQKKTFLNKETKGQKFPPWGNDKEGREVRRQPRLCVLPLLSQQNVSASFSPENPSWKIEKKNDLNWGTLILPLDSGPERPVNQVCAL